MKVKKSELYISAAGQDQYPDEGKPEIALAGRSNVGKSSFINKLLGRKNLAYTSGKPGKTRLLNFFNINDAFYFVDVPGYGYAKVSKSERAAWGRLIENYLQNREELCGVVLIIDVRHAPTKDDIAMYDWLKHFEIPVIIAATKADKVPKTKRPRHLKQVRETLEPEEEDELILFSSETGEGMTEAWQAIERKMRRE
ncbi:GTP-binding protein [Salsuginibacillus halophilus]|uniref:Probable GTP-binding protein EngB n=1 Tax=Salsuginibacillus halophilus TaxID=517424 RepID=A0A2P8HCW4_9BACI|nr:ribosome biogenesis GTP-binding protein YihA/YsxC [Salsuginibacillus halophilus]PSL44002.1 GTP-binding protein [Salsuginibacillus halophilus]